MAAAVPSTQMSAKLSTIGLGNIRPPAQRPGAKHGVLADYGKSRWRGREERSATSGHLMTTLPVAKG